MRIFPMRESSAFQLAMECPFCFQSDEIHASRKRGKDLLLLLISISPYRCWNCSKRFYAFRLPDLRRVFAALKQGFAALLESGHWKQEVLSDTVKSVSPSLPDVPPKNPVVVPEGEVPFTHDGDREETALDGMCGLTAETSLYASGQHESDQDETQFCAAAVNNLGEEGVFNEPSSGDNPGELPGDTGQTESSPLYVWSSKSAVYHRAGCKCIKMIGPENLQMGDVLPSGKTRHQVCPQ
jgi:hypothetical protein